MANFNYRLTHPDISDISMSLSGMPIGHNLSSKISGKKVSGKMQRCAFSAVIRNSSYSIVSATIRSISGSDSIVEASVSYSGENGNTLSVTGDSGGAVMGREFDLYPGRSMLVSFVSIKHAMVTSASTGGYSGSITVGFSYRSVEQGGPSGNLGSVTRSVEV